MKLKSKIIVFFIFIFLGISLFSTQALARPVDPPTADDYADFLYEPYPTGTNRMTIYYRHDSPGTMYIRLYNPNDNLVKSWAVTSSSGYKYYTGNLDGVWRLQCYRGGYTYWTDAAVFHTFGITDPAPAQDNLAADWARHPQNSDIYQQAFSILGQTTSFYLAAEKIYDHVIGHFEHNKDDITFRSDGDLLSDFNTHDTYYGVCRSDAVILTSYARALGIPARIIGIYALSERWSIEEYHYFAEFYVSGQWVPVDGDPVYNWFGLTEANQRISATWSNKNSGGRWRLTFFIVTKIPTGGIVEDGYSTTNYPGHPYRNDL